MIVYFVNHTRHIVSLRVDDGTPYLIQPHETASIDRKDSDVIKAIVKRNCDSYVTKGTISYHLTIETEYLFSRVVDGEVFNITREKMQISLNTFYDRLFLSAENALYLSETHKVATEEKIKKVFNKSQLSDLLFDLFIEPLVDFLFAGFIRFVLLIIIGIALTFIWGWELTVVFFLVAYLLLVAVHWLTDKLGRFIEKKVFKLDPKQEFYGFFENEFIKNYYADPKRAPYMGDAEIN